MDAWAPLGLISVTAALLAMPVAPAFYELRKRGDVTPLPTSRHDGRITNFAESFYSRIESLQALLEECRVTSQVTRANSENMEVLLVGREDFDFDPPLLAGVAAVLCCSRASVPSGAVIDADIYSEAELEIGQGAAIRAALASGSIVLGKNSVSLRWLHAHTSVRLQEGSTSCGRLSAGESITLEHGCGFQRMHAPTIVTASSGPNERGTCEFVSDLLPDFEEEASALRPRIRIHGDFILPAGESMTGNVIATGNVHFGRGCRFVGVAKSYKDTIAEEGASIQGSIVCGGKVHLGKRSFVAGPIISEREVIIERGVRIGAPDALTTISSCLVQIATGCQLHGTVWARIRGIVEG